MLAEAALTPSAPLLIPGLVERHPGGLGPVRAAADAAVRPLADCAVVVVLAGRDSGEPAAAGAAARGPGVVALVHDGPIDLAGIGRPDVRRGLRRDEALAEAIGAPSAPSARLPVDLAALALRVDAATPVVCLGVDPGAGAEALVSVGERLAAAAEADPRAVGLLAAADGSAALESAAPRGYAEGAERWQRAFLDAVAGADSDALDALGPAEAARVASRGWAPATVAAAAAARRGWRLEITAHAAPRGVGYLVARSAEAVGG